LNQRLYLAGGKEGIQGALVTHCTIPPSGSGREAKNINGNSDEANEYS
jgi:hypothetical protein